MPGSEQQTLSQDRVSSIDALRGFTMFWLIGGGAVLRILRDVSENPVTLTIYRQLNHVKWEGFTFVDLIMPLFLFVVGVVLPFSVLRHLLLWRYF